MDDSFDPWQSRRCAAPVSRARTREGSLRAGADAVLGTAMTVGWAPSVALRAGFAAWLVAAVAASSVLGCDGSSSDSAVAPTAGQPNFDAGMVPEPDAQTASPDAATGPSGEQVELRWVAGIPNAPAVSICHDPDRMLDNPGTLQRDESTDGPQPARVLTAASLGFGEATGFALDTPIAGGVLTFHDATAMVPSWDGDAGVGDSDGGASFPGEFEHCTDATLLFALELPLADVDLDEQPPPAPPRDIQPRLQAGLTLTLYTSGLYYERASAEQFAAQVAMQSLASGAGEGAADMEAADRLAERLRARGPAVIAQGRATAPSATAAALHLAHLVPDVPSAEQGVSGPVLACLTEGAVALAAPYPRAGEAPFRARSWLTNDIQPGLPYTVRVYARDTFQAEGKDCVTTNLSPLAEGTIAAGSLQAGKAYTMVARGAADPTALCAPPADEDLPWAPCPQGPDLLGANLLLIDE